MEEVSKVHVGLDVHKDSISIGVAEPGRAPGRMIGKIAHDVNKLLRLLVKVGAEGGVHIVYEAGPTGYGLQRALSARGYECEVIAPAQMPRRPGDRVKTDGGDWFQLAGCSRAGARMRLTAVCKCVTSSKASCCATACVTRASAHGPRSTTAGWRG